MDNSNNSTTIQYQSKFGKFSADLNRTLGDTTGRTVSMRTAHGLKRLLNLNEMSDNVAEGIVHVGMVAIPPLMVSKNADNKLMGIILSIWLIGCYQNGK